jgi:hypothetical protein
VPSFVTSRRAAACARAAFAAALFACGAAQAEEIGYKRLELRLPEHLSRGDAHMQIRTGLGYAGPGAGSEFGALLQPRIDARYGALGNVFAVATTTGGVQTGGAESIDTMPEDRHLTEVKQLYAGWSSGSLLGALGDDALTLSAGREAIEDGGGILNWFSPAESCDTGCWLRRRSTGFRTFSANLAAGAVQQRVFYATNLEAADAPGYAGMRTTVTGSSFEVLAGVAAPIGEHRPAIDDRPMVGRISASYKLGEALVWSPVLSSAYGFALSTPQDGLDAQTLDDPLAHGGRARTFELGLSLQPGAGTTLKAGYSGAMSENWLHALDAAAEWRPARGMALRVLGRVFEADLRDGQPQDIEREASLNGSVDLAF